MVKEVLKVEKKKQKISVSYTLKAFKGNIDKLKELGLVSAKQDEDLREIQKNIVDAYVKREFM